MSDSGGFGTARTIRAIRLDAIREINNRVEDFGLMACLRRV